MKPFLWLAKWEGIALFLSFKAAVLTAAITWAMETTYLPLNQGIIVGCATLGIFNIFIFVIVMIMKADDDVPWGK